MEPFDVADVRFAALVMPALMQPRLDDRREVFERRQVVRFLLEKDLVRVLDGVDPAMSEQRPSPIPCWYDLRTEMAAIVTDKVPLMSPQFSEPLPKRWIGRFTKFRLYQWVFVEHRINEMTIVIDAEDLSVRKIIAPHP